MEKKAVTPKCGSFGCRTFSILPKRKICCISFLLKTTLLLVKFRLLKIRLSKYVVIALIKKDCDLFSMRLMC